MRTLPISQKGERPKATVEVVQPTQPEPEAVEEVRDEVGSCLQRFWHMSRLAKVWLGQVLWLQYTDWHFDPAFPGEEDCAIDGDGFCSTAVDPGPDFCRFQADKQARNFTAECDSPFQDYSAAAPTNNMMNVWTVVPSDQDARHGTLDNVIKRLREFQYLDLVFTGEQTSKMRCVVESNQ